MNLNSKQHGFTLSEVLITIVIIGIIAAITVPILMTKHQKIQTVNLLKKAYSSLSQTTEMSIFENGPISTWETDGDNAKLFSSTYIKPYLNKMKDCEFKIDNDCAFKYTPLNSNVFTSLGKDYDRFSLLDGQVIAVRTPTNSQYGTTARLFIDINGQRKPNKLGRDVFVFIYWINSSNEKLLGKFIPYGCDWTRKAIIGTGNSYNCNKEKTGELCAALIMKDNWQISKDYPW